MVINVSKSHTLMHALPGVAAALPPISLRGREGRLVGSHVLRHAPAHARLVGAFFIQVFG